MSSRCRRARLVSLSILTLGGAFSCSVFPDEAVLPSSSVAGSATGTAGDGSTSLGGIGGDGMDVVPLAGATTSLGGAPGDLGGAPTVIGTGGAVDAPGGAGGAPSDCANPQQQMVAVTADTWIESAKPATGHGNDKMISVVGGGQERRALFQVMLPAILPGAVLLKATLALHLQANADVGLAKRLLRVHQLAQEVSESRTTWNNWAQGNRAWTTPGGDFGAALAQAALPAGTSEGALTFNVTAAVRAAFAPQPVPLPLIVIETSAPPAAPADLAFTSREGDASSIPALILEYCSP